MARPRRVEIPGGIYHVIARGNEKKPVFRDDADREIYLARLAHCRERFRITVLAYCLMDNHVHLALARGSVALSRVMLALQSYYAQKFNFRHDRVGHLFQGRYKAFLVQEERYLVALVRYIHLNPVRAGVAASPESYRWSSDRFYRRGSGPDWLDLGRVLSLLGAERRRAAGAYRRLMGATEFSPSDSESPSYEDAPAHGCAVKGERDFAERAFLATGEPLKPPRAWTPEDLGEAVARMEGLSILGLKGPRGSLRESRARLIAAYLGRCEAGIPVARMARVFGREESTFNRGVKRLEEAIKQDRAIAERVLEIASSLRIGSTGIHD